MSEAVKISGVVIYDAPAADEQPWGAASPWREQCAGGREQVISRRDKLRTGKGQVGSLAKGHWTNASWRPVPKREAMSMFRRSEESGAQAGVREAGGADRAAVRIRSGTEARGSGDHWAASELQAVHAGDTRTRLPVDRGYGSEVNCDVDDYMDHHPNFTVPVYDDSVVDLRSWNCLNLTERIDRFVGTVASDACPMSSVAEQDDGGCRPRRVDADGGDGVGSIAGCEQKSGVVGLAWSGRDQCELHQRRSDDDGSVAASVGGVIDGDITDDEVGVISHDRGSEHPSMAVDGIAILWSY